MSAVNFNTANQTLRQLLGNGLTYRVPRFQREYSWTEDEWEELWLDAVATLEGREPAHYLGYLVLQSGDSRVFEVIDGQQRLTTLSLLVLAVLRNLSQLAETGDNPDRNKQRAEQLRQAFIGYLDPVTLTPRSKLSLNRVDDPYYQNHLVPMGRLPERRTTASQKRLSGAYRWFVAKTMEWVESRSSERLTDPDRRGTLFAELVDRLADRLFFTVITVTDELNAFKVFETLNARGVKLSPTDLLKNYLFSVVARDKGTDEDIRSLEERWQGLVSGLEQDDFPDFLRTHWNSRFASVRHAELFKTIRLTLEQRGQVFDLVRALEEDLDTYRALSDPHDSGWTSEQSEAIGELRMFSVRQPYPLLLACRRRLSAADFTRVLRAVVVVSLRWNVIGAKASGEQERAYQGAAQAVESRELTTAAQVLQRLRTIVLPDEEFRKLFEEKSISTSSARNRKVIKYLLMKLERQASNSEFDPESDLYNIEHVLPEHPSSAWSADFTDDEAERFTHRLGNLALLKAKANRELGNASYPEKRPELAASEFTLTSSLAEEAETWTADKIAARQRRLARLATAIWRVD